MYLFILNLRKCFHLGRRQMSCLVSSTLSLQLLLVFLSFLAMLPFSDALSANNQIHKQFSINDLRKVFQVESHDQVPEYELVHPRTISKRSVDDDPTQDDVDKRNEQIHLSAFGKQLKLNLKKNTQFNNNIENMKVFMAETTKNGKLKYVEAPISNNDKQDDLGTTYHDESNMAAVLLGRNSNGQLQMHGTIGNDLVIRPVPSSVSSQYNQNTHSDDDDEMFLDEDEAIELAKRHIQNASNSTTNSNATFSSSALPIHMLNTKLQKIGQTNSEKKYHDNKNPHVVFKRKMYNPESHSDYLSLEPGVSVINQDKNWTLSSTHKSRRTKRQAPDTVWPEVLLVVDYDSFILHGATSRDVKRYFISFWNGVDLRYKLLTHPQIRVSLAGMIVAKDREATPYLERNRLRAPNADAVDAAGALTDMGKYLYREDRLPTYDLAVVITKLDMCRRRYEGGRCNRGTAGFAYVGGACVVNKRLEKVNSVAIIEDSGGFSGIIVAAHEVGHLLGCVHDGSPPPSYLGGPGATRCPWEDGFIMSDLRHTERGFRWSSCSVEQFKHFLNGETATCLYNFPHENQLLPRVLPGTMLTLDEQCKRDRGTNACFKDARVCAQLFCFDSASGYCVSYRPAAEGSPCGDGQVCRNGKCVTEIENIIPDYTHVTQTVVRNQPSNVDRLLPRSDQAQFVPPKRVKDHLKNRSGLSRSAATRSLKQPNINESTQSHRAKQCKNNIERMAGSLTCTEFLEKFGERYCNHNYIKRNCCASHLVMCKGRK